MISTDKKYLILLYDNSLDGLLSAIFDIYRLKLSDFDIIPSSHFQEKLFQPILSIRTNKAKANRIKIGLKRKTGQNLLPALMKTFKDTDNKEIAVYQFIKEVFAFSVNRNNLSLEKYANT